MNKMIANNFIHRRKKIVILRKITKVSTLTMFSYLKGVPGVGKEIS
jgi:hypothetical protein